MSTTQPLVNLEAARTVVAGALAHARDNDLPPMTVAVLDAAGQLMAFAREDGSSLRRGRIARGKARGALKLGVGGRSLAARAATHPAFINSAVALADSGLVPAAGGVLVRDNGDDVVGAVGVSGSLPDDDEACAVAGIAAAGLGADPGA
jgi:uncharacterized protein GlcG (DUF336 family)